MSSDYVISIMTRDRVGIIADVTGAIQKLEGNLADLSQTVLRGYFSMIVIASFPKAVHPEDIRRAFLALDPDNPFEIGIKPYLELPNLPDSVPEENKYVVTVTGPDRVGFVAAVSRHLAAHGINIEDLTTTVEQDHYIMFLLVDLPAETSVAHLKKTLQAEMAEIGATVELQHRDIFRATNEI